MQKIKSLVVVVFVALAAACSPEYVEPLVEQKSEETIVRIRSGSSLNEKEPIFVVNGKIVEKEALRQMDPNKIASVSVIKNKQASALYGEKGKNGVVIVTLKD